MLLMFVGDRFEHEVDALNTNSSAASTTASASYWLHPTPRLIRSYSCSQARVSPTPTYVSGNQLTPSARICADDVNHFLKELYFSCDTFRDGTELLSFLSSVPLLAASKRPRYRLLATSGTTEARQHVEAVIDVCIVPTLTHLKHVFVLRHACDTLCQVIKLGGATDIVGHPRFSELQSELKRAAEIHAGTEDNVRRVDLSSVCSGNRCSNMESRVLDNGFILLFLFQTLDAMREALWLAIS
jgi:hypothetical protein